MASNQLYMSSCFAEVKLHPSKIYWEKCNDPKIVNVTISNQKFLQQKRKSLFPELQIIPSKFYLFKYYHCFQVMIFQTLRKSFKRSSTLWNQIIKIQTWIATRRLKNSENKSGVFTIKDNQCRMPAHSQWEMKTLWCHRWERENQIVCVVML